MSIANLNYLNIALMLAAAVLAAWLPFEVFVLAYVLLGPLHYLTEIAWLKQRQFFTTGKRDFLWLAALCCLVFGWYLLHKLQPALLTTLNHASWLKNLGAYTNQGYGAAILAAFGGALAMTMRWSTAVKLATVLGAGLLGWFVMANLNAYVVVGLLLPSLIHVFVFTGVFLLNGALHSKHPSGVASAVVFASCAAFLLLVPVAVHNSGSNPALFGAWTASDFYPLNNVLMRWLSDQTATFNDLFRSATGLRVQRFIAFAYLYHYLNWFSKTGVIGWHKVPRAWLVAAVAVWIGIVALWWFNFVYGFAALFLLSMLHVFLEFPLNHKSFRQLGQHLATRFSKS